jgi:HemY protein
MIRVVVYFLAIAIAALAAAWMADRPGDVVITWLGYNIQTSVGVAAAAVAILCAVVVLLWSLLRLLFRSRHLIARGRANRRRNNAQRAVSRGLIAIGAGDLAMARRYAHEAERLAPGEPLALLLSAQMAQASGDRAGAERAFRAMADRSDTRVLGLRGLYVEAQRRNEGEAARHYAEAAAHAAPALPWAGAAVLADRSSAGDWSGALAALERMKRAGAIDKATHRRQRAVLLTARALAEQDEDAARAKTHVLEAVRLAPDLVPAAALAGKMLGAAGELRKAARVVEAAWRAEPHPDLADVYAHLRYGDAARDRLARAQTLARLAPHHVESGLAVARAALEAQEFSVARKALSAFTAAPTQRVAMMMAEIEEAEHGDVGRTREWMTRALRAAQDPAWTADGIVSDHWMAVSPVTGEVDAFRWRAPVSEISAPIIEEPERSIPERPVIPAPSAAAPVHEAPAQREAPQQREAPADALGVATPTDDGKVPTSEMAPPAPPSAPENSGDRRTMTRDASAHRTAEPVVEAVIPLVHAPDDPGPEEPAPSAPDETPRRSLFR